MSKQVEYTLACIFILYQYDNSLYQQIFGNAMDSPVTAVASWPTWL